ncbi:type II toxin-antitoxin system HigB family toxin [Ravibacter arvi]|uniref:Type II toxin-antitoxin system HigB family toxin n=1 Tax=Ravibacter arvi TaxID=2051041 RepID=A0ABP8M196_9BACT
MRIVTFSRIKEFSGKHPDADIPLRDWYFKTLRSEWDNFHDMKKTFNSVDYVGNNRFVFNIKGNDYLLVAIVIFASKKVYIRFIGNHKDYDRIDSKNI